MLADVVDFCNRDFASNGCPARCYLGVEHLADNDEPLRVVFVPTRDLFRPPVVPTGGRSGIPFGRPVNPQALAIRDCGFDAHIWAAAPPLADPSLQVAADYAMLQSLINQVCQSIWTMLQGSWRPLGGETVQSGLGQLGHVYVLRGSVEMPVVTTHFHSAVDCRASTWEELFAAYQVKVAESGQTVSLPAIGTP